MKLKKANSSDSTRNYGFHVWSLNASAKGGFTKRCPKTERHDRKFCTEDTSVGKTQVDALSGRQILG